MSNSPLEEIRKLLKTLEGLNCWHVDAGEGTGSSFHLALGEKVLRRVPLRSAQRGEEYGKYQGEASILVWCTWRLDSLPEPIASSDEDYKVIANALNILVGQKILEVMIFPPALDLCISFSNNLGLRVFCDHVPGNPSFEGNWQVRVQDTIVGVGPGYRWEVEPMEPL